MQWPRAAFHHTAIRLYRREGSKGTSTRENGIDDQADQRDGEAEEGAERNRPASREEFRRREKERKADQRREALKSAAIEIFAERGYHAAKVSDIVSEVGVAQGTFYLYYDGKKQLFEEILNDFLALLVRTIANWQPGALDSRQALGDQLRRVGRQLTEVIDDRQKLATIYFKQSMAASPEFDTLVRQFHETLTSMLTSFNEVLWERDLIASADFRILATMTIGMVERIVMEYVIHDKFDEVAHEAIVEHLVVHYLEGTSEPMNSGVEE